MKFRQSRAAITTARWRTRIFNAFCARLRSAILGRTRTVARCDLRGDLLEQLELARLGMPGHPDAGHLDAVAVDSDEPWRLEQVGVGFEGGVIRGHLEIAIMNPGPATHMRALDLIAVHFQLGLRRLD